MIKNLVAQRTGLPQSKVFKTVELLDDGATIPFIARYRKEATGSLDEVQISTIQQELRNVQDLLKRKEAILKSIEEQGQLTAELKKRIQDTWNDKTLEDLYLPFKRKQQTKAAIARKAGYEGLAKIIMAQRTDNIRSQAKRFGDPDEALEGAGHIISEWISENPAVRDIVRSIFNRKAIITSKVIKNKKEEASKYRDYFDYNGLLKKTPSHRLLAILRGENEGMLRSKVDIDIDEAQSRLNRYYIKRQTDAQSYIISAIEDSLKRLILPSIRNEALKDAKDAADKEAIKVFARNAADLLLSPPLGAKKVMGIDPGFRTGCKVVCLDEKGDLQKSTTIYPHPPQNHVQKAEDEVYTLISKFETEAIAVGNGTAGRETFLWLKKLNLPKVEIYLVNEDGASIYSASEIAREEFPNEDLTVRGAVSIGRRLMDPLAELVKIDPKSIGVGQYQHDVNQKLLKESLTETVEACVNKVGINLNTASKHLLSYVSGLGPGLAQNIVDYRSEIGKFTNIEQLKEVPRLGVKAFEQCAGFIRIKDGVNPLDNTGVHPESYSVVENIIKTLRTELSALVGNVRLIESIDLSQFVNSAVGLPTVYDIVNELKKPGLDPRSKAKQIDFQEGLETISDLRIGQILQGQVTNLTKFGAFIDIGIKESALLHISQITDRFISDPAEVLSIQQSVEVKVTDVDLKRKRISVSMLDVN
ncbi:Tex family protein [Portibacter marinus]|uniref:Tex family protein n=1 Tax=Portibacter marinus TaxID=2898660 RepID=UPI001F3AE965|nr:Tex family protein [Portibacter marinus]